MPTNQITNVIIDMSVRRGTLTYTGTLGQYTYQSYPRYKGYDSILFRVVDSSGVTSKNSAIALIEVTDGPGPYTNRATGDVGINFVYQTGSFLTNIYGLYYYKDGTITTLVSSLPRVNAINGVATDRLNNIIYYSERSSCRIRGYDYVNNHLFLLYANSSITGSIGLMYYNKHLFYVPDGGSFTNYYYIFNLGPYSYNPNTGKGTQYVNASYRIPCGPFDGGDFTWDYVRSKLIYFSDTSGDPVLYIDPLTGYIYDSSNTLTIGFPCSFYGNDNCTYIVTSTGVLYRYYINTSIIFNTGIIINTSTVDCSEWFSYLY